MNVQVPLFLKYGHVVEDDAQFGHEYSPKMLISQDCFHLMGKYSVY